MDEIRFCPACWQPVEQTPVDGLIATHFDGTGRRPACNGTGHPWRITLALMPTRRRKLVAE